MKRRIKRFYQMTVNIDTNPETLEYNPRIKYSFSFQRIKKPFFTMIECCIASQIVLTFHNRNLERE